MYCLVHSFELGLNWGAVCKCFQKLGARAPQAPMDGTPMLYPEGLSTTLLESQLWFLVRTKFLCSLTDLENCIRFGSSNNKYWQNIDVEQ